MSYPVRSASHVLPCAFTALLAVFAPASAQDDYPSKPIKIILPVAVGGASDRVIRMVGKRLTDQWNQPFVIEAKPGATGALGAEAVAKSPPDGYTALFASTTFIQAPALFQKVPYDYLKDFAPVSLTTGVTVVLVVSSESPIHTLKDYLAAGTPEKPVPTYGGDTTLRLPSSNSDDRELIRRAQHEVAKIYFAADRYVGGDRVDYIRREIARKYPE